MKDKIKIYGVFIAFMILTTGLRYVQHNVLNFQYCGEISPIFISVLFILLNRNDSFKMLSFNKFEFKPVLIPILLILFTFVIDFIVQLRFQLIQPPVLNIYLIPKLLFTSVLFFIVIGGFEEMGWRGYLTSKIIQNKLSWIQLIIITSIIWAIWHLPTHYSHFEHHFFIQYSFFILFCIEWSIIMVYLRIKTNSVLPAIILHTLIPIISENFFKSIPDYWNQPDLYFFTFPSIVINLLLLPVSIYYYKIGNKLYLDNLTGASARIPKTPK